MKSIFILKFDYLFLSEVYYLLYFDILNPTVIFRFANTFWANHMCTDYSLLKGNKLFM